MLWFGRNVKHAALGQNHCHCASFVLFTRLQTIIQKGPILETNIKIREGNCLCSRLPAGHFEDIATAVPTAAEHI